MPSVGSSSLGSRYWRFWAAATTSAVGDGIRQVALPLLLATMSRNPLSFAAVACAGQAPWFLLGPVAGALVDRGDRRRIMWSVDAVRAAVVAALAGAAYLHVLTVPVLCVVAFILGSGETLFDNAAPAALQSIIEPELLDRANARAMGAQMIAFSFIGPPLGAFLLAVSLPAPFILDAISFGVAAAIVLQIHGRFSVGLPPVSERRRSLGITDGFRWMWRSPMVRLVAMLEGSIQLITVATLSILALYALDELGAGSMGYGLIFVAGAAGGLISSAVAPSVSFRISRATTLAAASALVGLATVMLGTAPNLGIALLASVIEGFAVLQWNVSSTSLLQASIPQDLFGRVNSVYLWLGWSGATIGALLGGVLAGAAGLRFPIVGGGILMIVIACVAAPRLAYAARASADRPAAVASDELLSEWLEAEYLRWRRGSYG